MSEHIVIVRHLSKNEAILLAHIVEVMASITYDTKTEKPIFEHACVQTFDMSADHFVQPVTKLVIDL